MGCQDLCLDFLASFAVSFLSFPQSPSDSLLLPLFASHLQESENPDKTNTQPSRKLPRFETALWLQFAYFWTGLFVIEILYFFVLCYPFDQYWALPVRNAQCATYHNYSIVQMVFNISSDIGLILTPLPMVWVAQLPVKRKLILTLVFGLASFTVMAAALNKYVLSSPVQFPLRRQNSEHGLTMPLLTGTTTSPPPSQQSTSSGTFENPPSPWSSQT